METLRLYLGIIRDSLKNFRRLFVVHHLTLMAAHHEGEDIKTFVFKSNRPLNHTAGQYGLWVQKRWVNGKPARLFTVASPVEEGIIQLSTRITKSDFKQKLNQLKPGDQMFMVGPIGEFTLPKQLPGEIVFVAGGIGITPIRALSKRIRDNSLPVTTTLVHNARGFYLYERELKKYIGKTNYTTNDNFEPTLSRIAEEQPKAIFYISGPPGFVESTRKFLLTKHISRIKTDGFLGY